MLVILAIVAILGLLLIVAAASQGRRAGSATSRPRSSARVALHWDSPDEDADYRRLAATDAQRNYIEALGGKAPARLTKLEASALITELIEKRDAEREAEYQAEKLAKAREKEQTELAHLAAAMADPAFKPRKRRSKRLQDLADFQLLLNQVFLDGVIETDEAVQLRDWLTARRVLELEFAPALAILDRVIAGTATADDAGPLYSSLLDALRDLRARPNP